MVHAKYLANHLRSAKLVILPGQGHFLLQTVMDEILTTLTNE